MQDSFRRLLFSLALAVFLFSTSVSTSVAASGANVMLFRSADYLSRNYQVQNFQDTINLQPSQENLPLTLNIYNGSHEAPSFKWFRLVIGGYTLATEKVLNGREEGSIDVTTQIPGGSTQVAVEAGGVPGALLRWTLTTSRVAITGIDPQNIKSGDTVTITGANFSSVASQNTVLFNNKRAQVISASPGVLQVTAPTNVNAGVDSVQVNVNGLVSNALEVRLATRVVPELLSTDCWMAPPGGTITITGRNLSPGELKVYFQDVPGQVVSASASQVVVIVPQWPYGSSQINIPLSVVVDGVRSANSIPFDIGPMYHGAIPTVQPD